MTQADKDLLLKDLCARLPYDVKVSKVVGDYISEPRPIRSINLNNIIVEDGEFEDGTPDIDVWAYEDFKPYLFPLSSMTEEQKEEFNTQSLKLQLQVIDEEIMYEKATEFEVDFYNKHHLDWRGLIPMGLAIDATNKNIY